MPADLPTPPRSARPHGLADRLLVVGVVALGALVLLLALGARPTDTAPAPVNAARAR